MADDLRKLIADGEKLGFKYIGQVFRGGHIQFIHNETGERLTASSTPSSAYSWNHTRKDMERISGRKLPRDNKGKHVFRKCERLDLKRTEVEVKNSERIEELVAHADSLRQRFRSLTISPNRDN